MVRLIKSKNHNDVAESIGGNGCCRTDDLHVCAESFLEEEVVPKWPGFVFGAEGMLAEVGFSFGVEAALAEEENHSTYRLIIYILTVRGLRNYFRRPLGQM